MAFLRRGLLASLVFLIPVEAQQTIYWKKDHIYDTSGRELAMAVPLPSDVIAPTPPLSLAYSQVGRQSARLDWSASTDSGGSGLAGYKIYRGPIPVGTVGPATLSFTDDSLQPGANYTFTVIAFDNAQNHSAASNAVTFSTTLGTASDDFNRPDGPLGPNWSGSSVCCRSVIPVIRANRAGTNDVSTTNRTARYTGIAWGPAHSSQITLAPTIFGIAAAIVRMQTTDSFYAGGFDNGDFNNSGGTYRCRIFKYTYGVPSSLQLDNTCVVNPGDTLKLEAQGTTLRFYLNGILKLTATDTSYTSGAPGFIFNYNQADASVVDNWVGTDLAN